MNKLAILLIGLFVPMGVSAQMVITEVMYDLPGSDSGREWVEIHNTGSSSVNLADWRFFEQDTNHRFQNEGDVSLGSGERAIIADDADAFKNDNPNINALILESSFSLKNTGEYIALKNTEEKIVDEVTYTPQADADGEGASLQFVNGSWGAYTPTPGSENVSESIGNGGSENNNQDTPPSHEATEGQGAETQNTNESEEDNNTDTNTDTETVDSTRPVPPDIYVYGGDDRTVIVGADVTFEGSALGVEKEPLKEAQYIWNFGDGATAEGETVTHHFVYPGTYIVVVTAVSGELSASDYVRVKAKESDIAISDVSPPPDAHIAIENGAHRDVHIGNWYVQTNNETFQFPSETYIASGSTLTFPKRTTGLSPKPSSVVRLLYPNTNTAFTYPKNTKESLGETQEANGAGEDKEKQSKPSVPADEPASVSQDRLKEKGYPHTSIARANTGVNTTSTHNDVSQKENHTSSVRTAAASSSNTSAVVIGGDTEALDWGWILGLVFLLLLAIGGLGFMRYKEATATKEEQTAHKANEYAIIEDE